MQIGMIHPLTHRIDLLLWDLSKNNKVDWQIGEVWSIPTKKDAAHEQIGEWAVQSNAEFGLFWTDESTLPSELILKSLIETKLDIAHAGLSEGMDDYWPSLAMIKQDWSMINAPTETPSTSWRISLRSCLVRRSLIVDLDGIDPAFMSLESAGLDFGYRALRMGAIVEYRPELVNDFSNSKSDSLPLQDLYLFILRHHSLGWAKYILARRIMADLNFNKELKAFKGARSAFEHFKRPHLKPVNYPGIQRSIDPSLSKRVSVIIPTLGRYDYIPGALASLLEQTIQPYEVIVVDQNSVPDRQPQVYEGYEALNLRVIWQDQRGQSLARNTGLAAARGEYVFLFDDDSIAKPDLIEQHLVPVLEGFVDVSTGVAIPPPPAHYKLPPAFRFPKLAQTFDTGNSLLSLNLAKKIGGLDRNYDFGPGADADFGTRLYLAGCRIFHNPEAVRIHYKAPSGGLRVYRSYKYNTDAGLLAPFPPVTRSYYCLRFLNPKQQREMSFLSFLLSKFPKNQHNRRLLNWDVFISSMIFSFSLIFFPIKLQKSFSQAKRLLLKGPQFGDFGSVNEGQS